MNLRNPGVQAAPLFAWLFLLVSAARAESGVVLDKSTNKPISSAVVVALWSGEVNQIVQRQGTCYRAELTRSDELGHFSVSTFSGNLDPMLMSRQRDVIALAPGYRMAPSKNPEGLEILMEPQSGSTNERIKRLPGLQPLGCGADASTMIPYLKELHQEIADLATTPDELTLAAQILYSLEEIEIGDPEAGRRYGQRLADIKKGARQ